MLTRAVLTSKNTRSECAQPGTHVFVYLHVNGNPSRVIHECIVHERASLGKQYMPASTSNTQVTRVHECEEGDMQVRSPLSTGPLWYLRCIDHHSIGLSTHYDYYHEFH